MVNGIIQVPDTGVVLNLGALYFRYTLSQCSHHDAQDYVKTNNYCKKKNLDAALCGAVKLMLKLSLSVQQ